MALSQQASSRQEALQARHAALEARIHELRRHPSVSDVELRHLKVEKLRLKEEMQS